jgi:hypothetical protein
MSANTTSFLQTCVVGCGECGSRIAAYFDKMPSFLQHRATHLYPFRCAAIDTDLALTTSLRKPPWNWREIEDIHLIQSATAEIIDKRIFPDSSTSSAIPSHSVRGGKSGSGGFPYIGTITAEEYLLKENPIAELVRRKFQDRGFTRGALLIANSLTGGTGTGFGPAMPDFFSTFYDAKIIFNLSIVPQLTILKNRQQTYPASIIYGLYRLSKSKRVDAVILADNDILSRDYNCKGNPEYNSLLHEILSGILLAPTGEYNYPSFRSTMDFSNLQRWLRPKRGMGNPELCALSYAVKKSPNRFYLRFMGPKRRAEYINKWLRGLVDSAASRTTVGRIEMNLQGAIGVLSGPPEFFDKILGGEEQYYSNLLDYAYQKITPNLALACLQFPKMKDVRLSLILSGVTSPKLEEIYREVIPPGEQVQEGTLMERIRHVDNKTIEDLMLKEIREELSKQTTDEDKRA